MRSLSLLSQLPSLWVRLYSLPLRMFENLNWAGTHIKWWQHFVAQASVKDPGTWQAHLESEQGPFPWIIQTYANSTGHCGGCCCLLVVMHDDYGGLWGVSWAVVELLLANLLQATGAAKSPLWVPCEPKKPAIQNSYLRFLMVFTCSIDSELFVKTSASRTLPVLSYNWMMNKKQEVGLYAAEPPSNHSVMIQWFVLQCPHWATQNSWAHQHRSWILLPGFVSRKCQRWSAQGLTMQTWPWRVSVYRAQTWLEGKQNNYDGRPFVKEVSLRRNYYIWANNRRSSHSPSWI